MRRHSRLVTYLRSLVLLSTCWILASTHPLIAQEARHADVTEVVVIEVPVQVTKGGKPVRGLTPEHFELFDGRKQRGLTGFDAYDLSGTSAAPSQIRPRIPAAAQRKFLLFFDLSFSAPDSIVQAREAARELVSEGLDPSDLVGVAAWSASSGSNVILGFTSDRRQAALAIETLGLGQLAEARRDPLGLRFEEMRNEPSKQPTDGSFDWFSPTGTVTGSAGLRHSLMQMQSSTQQASERNAILALLSSLSEVAELLRSVDGRKYLVLLSEGFDSSVVFGQGGGATREEQEAIQRQISASAFGDYQNIDSNLRFGDTSTQNEMGRVQQEFMRADCVIHAVDIGGLRAGGDERARRESRHGLFVMADGTGGEFFENYGNLSKAMEAMLERTSVTYVLAFQAEDLKLDGEFHKLKVKLEGAPKGARLVYRPGYFAPRPYSEISQRERSLSAASRLFGAPGGELGVATLAAAFESGSQSAYVPSLIEIDGADLLKGTEGGQVAAEIYAYAIAKNGEVRDYYSQILGIDLQKAGPALEEKGLKLWSQFEVPPGEYVARVLVRNAVTGTSGVAVAPFRVPDAGEQEPALLPPLFPEPAGQWLNIRGQRAEESEHDYPFTVQGQAFEPAVKPVLVPGQSTPVLLAGYDIGDPVQIQGELFTLDGKPEGRVFMNVGEPRAGDRPGLMQWAATLSASGVEPGDYILKVTATEPDSGETHSSSIMVSVSG